MKDNGKDHTDIEISEFVDKFKAAYDTFKIKKDRKDNSIRIVSGEEIRYWYNYEHYCIDAINHEKGTLGMSCMRYKICQPYFDIYVNNPEVCSMVIFTDDDNRLRARALLWKTNNGLYLDRTYYTDQSEHHLMNSWVDAKFKLGTIIRLGTSNDDRKNGMEVQLGDFKYNEYPYMDTFEYLDTSRNVLMRSRGRSDRNKVYSLESTTGEATIYCEREQDLVDIDKVVWSDYYKCWVSKIYAIFSNYYNSEIFKPESVFSNTCNSYLPEDKTYNVIINSDGIGTPLEMDYLPEDDDTYDVVRYRNAYYLSKCVPE